ncbi:zinc finger CCHC domain-containing protein 7 [Apus apus]|uniref:zinc finger CCHC domain-containing protein 7 n=1 Tax=Apus apus TaxID=8895 RepID=UPI0021F88CD6|nr:zinc finger CCHC domain-containing protein 7 [Apus apus]XP_051499484.1 zinc finger CCHC domain-containing protein 7 [Apus apus]XP_051499485.1 zinc finger CCHC domain-containing protein 7 [Apus apus]XP_051499486.1 zinc finger CCHC domain-containing protein 7 [Apus apus]
MFVGYEDSEDTEGYEDELYHEESSSEESIDSEVEFHLYSQIHYSQNLGEISTLEVDEEADVAGVTGHSSVLAEQQHEDKKVADLAGHGDPEIIVLSDTPDEDSVYKSKAKKSASSLAHSKRHSPPGSSTPNPAKATGCHTLYPAGSGTGVARQKKSPSGKLNPISSAGAQAIQDVLVIDDSSEEESLISESDPVESWMLLGAGADDRDEDIMLNLEGCAAPASEGEGDVDWSISNKDLEAQISNYGSVRHSSVRYYTADKNVTCRNCGRPGHLSKNCPAPKKVPPCCLCAGRGHLQNSCPARFCLNCCLPGHYFRECLERAYWNKHCNRCDMKGHYADACPEIWRQYHLTTKPGPIKARGSHPERSALAYCYNCSQKGHFGYECSEKRMHGSMFPTSPFIYYYDDECDIKRRANRLKKKVAELQEAGLLPELSETLWQEEKHGGHSHKKKSKPWKEHRKHSRDGERHKKMKMSRAEKPREEKRRSHVGMGQNLEEDFSRGWKRQVCKGSKTRHKSLFRAFSGSKAGQEPLEGAKRKKKWKKQKDASPDVSENLFLIKQRRKKSKQKSW